LRKFGSFLIAVIFPWSVWAGDHPPPLQDSGYRSFPPDQIKLGQLLFYDRILSGTYRVSCATCHHPDRASSNGLRVDRKPSVREDLLAVNGLPVYDALKPSAKHAPALFNLGAREFTVLFGDGRVSRRLDGSFVSPAGSELPKGLRDVLAVQALFPAVTGDELIGRVDNELKDIRRLGHRPVWNALAARLGDIPDYWPYFRAAFPKLASRDQISIVHVANAISAFVATEWRSDNAPFDAWLRGNTAILSESQMRGMELFYGKARCASCHSGPFQTDHDFHSVATPLWSAVEDGLAADKDFHRDRFSQTGDDRDRFRRRTPSLRNVEWTPPYGHAGSFADLSEMLRAHLDPPAGLSSFVQRRMKGKRVPVRTAALVQEMSKRNELEPVDLTDQDFSDLIAFLHALSDEDTLPGKLGRPDEVPSALALD